MKTTRRLPNRLAPSVIVLARMAGPPSESGGFARTAARFRECLVFLTAPPVEDEVANSAGVFESELARRTKSPDSITSRRIARFAIAWVAFLIALSQAQGVRARKLFRYRHARTPRFTKTAISTPGFDESAR